MENLGSDRNESSRPGVTHSRKSDGHVAGSAAASNTTLLSAHLQLTFLLINKRFLGKHVGYYLQN